MTNGEFVCGDCVEEMKDMEENSVDAVVTDPPYGLAFMGKDWDDFEPKEFQEFSEEWGEQALRVLKPGGHLLAFCGTRTYHRMVVGLEDAGFEIRDQVAWMYGSGFPKGQDISKAIDKYKGKDDDRKEYKKNIAYEDSDCWGTPNKNSDGSQDGTSYNPNAEKVNVGKGKRIDTKPASKQAEKWDGWNTSLKPGHEPILVAQKPKEGTYAENVLEYGVGGLNINGCRINFSGENPSGSGNPNQGASMPGVGNGGKGSVTPDSGRWPANVVLDLESAEMLDRQSGISESNVRQPKDKKYEGMAKYDSENSNFSFQDNTKRGHDDKGGASRFFYSAKARKSERNAGLEDLEEQDVSFMGHENNEADDVTNRHQTKSKNDIATLKPINLMRWLVRLVTPEDGTVLDPFAGSGTTGCACEVEGFDYVLIEKRERFAEKIAPLRCKYWSNSENWTGLQDHTELPETEELRNGCIQDFMGKSSGSVDDSKNSKVVKEVRFS